MKVTLITKKLFAIFSVLSLSVAYAEEPMNPNEIKSFDESSEIEKAIDEALVFGEKEAPTESDKKNVQAEPENKKVVQKSEIKTIGQEDSENKNSIEKKSEDSEKVQVIVKKVDPKITKKSKVSKLSKEEADYLSSLDKEKESSKTSVVSQNKNEPVLEINSKKKSPRAYEPAPTEPQEVKHQGFVVERDSAKILKKRMTYSDALNVKVCYSAGLSIVLDEDIQTEFQRVIIDDKIFFDALDFDNHRGVYVKLKQPVPENRYWESAIRLVRKDNDKAYLVNLLGVPCPKVGTNPFPKTIYLQDKGPGISGRNSKIMTPEDTIIGLSEGFPRKNINNVNVYDMVARSGSEWVVFGIEVKTPGGADPEKFLLRVIDNLQISQIPSKIEFLPIQSEKASKSTNQNTLRYRVLVNIDKQYFTENRYVHLMLLDKKEEYYQYIRIDTLPYMLKLRERGFDI